MGQQISQINAFIHDPAVLRATYVLGWGGLFGFNVFQSFVAGIVGVKTLPRQTFGLLQSRLVPVYLGLSTLISASLLTLELKLRPALYTALKRNTLATLRELNDAGKFAPRQVLTSTVGLIAIGGLGHLVNGLVVTPKATQIMFRRHRLQRIEGRRFEEEPSEEMRLMNAKFTTLHSLSATLNTVSLVAAGLVGWKIGVAGVGPYGLGFARPPA